MEFRWLVLTSVAFNTIQRRNYVFDGCSWALSIHSCATIMTILARFLIVDSLVNSPPCTTIVIVSSCLYRWSSLSGTIQIMPT